ncbi:hypothetical protein MHEI_44320 [Mycobacterium heidelbergense]|nr:hypothetical protein MHEI_44320 [Mycobacterium heidelbergense]
MPYTTGPFLQQYGKTWRTIAKLSLPDRYLRNTSDNAPETRSERMFGKSEISNPASATTTQPRRGLKHAIAAVLARRELRTR